MVPPGSQRQILISCLFTANPTAPSVFPLLPSHQDLSRSLQVSLGCLVTGFFPEPVTVEWNSGSISTGIQTFPAIRASSSGLYTLSSQLTIPSSDLQSRLYHCTVIHRPTNSRIKKDIQPQVQLPPAAPIVRLLHSSCNSQLPSATLEIVCQITGFYPKDVTVEWLMGEQRGQLYPFTETPRKDENGHTFSTTSTLNISQSDFMNGNTFICEVVHTASKSRVRGIAKTCGGSSASAIKVFIQNPSPSDIFLDKKPKLTCVINNLESHSELEVIWSRERSRIPVPEPFVLKDELNGTITAYSTLIVSEDDWMSEETFTCTIRHPSLPLPRSVKINKKKGATTAPSVYLFRPHHEELISNGVYVSITALVKGFKPDDISLKWLKGGELVSPDNYIITPVFKDADDISVMFSRLIVRKSEWIRGDSFSCMVVHEGLSLKFIQKQIEKRQRKK